MSLRVRIREVITDRATRWLLIGSVASDATLWFGVWRFIPRQTNFNPLHYTIYFGINLTGSWLVALWIPIIGAAVILAHLIIMQVVRHETWRRLWALLSLFINILLVLDLVAVILLIRSNG